MAMANFWVKKLSEKINDKDLWNIDNIKKYKREFSRSEIYKHIIKIYKMTNVFFGQIFAELRTSEKINEKWDFFMDLFT